MDKTTSSKNMPKLCNLKNTSYYLSNICDLVVRRHTTNFIGPEPKKCGNHIWFRFCAELCRTEYVCSTPYHAARVKSFLLFEISDNQQTRRPLLLFFYDNCSKEVVLTCTMQFMKQVEPKFCSPRSPMVVWGLIRRLLRSRRSAMASLLFGSHGMYGTLMPSDLVEE